MERKKELYLALTRSKVRAEKVVMFSVTPMTQGTGAKPIKKTWWPGAGSCSG